MTNRLVAYNSSEIKSRVYEIRIIHLDMRETVLEYIYCSFKYAYKHIAQIANMLNMRFKYSLPLSNQYGFHYAKSNGLSIELWSK